MVGISNYGSVSDPYSTQLHSEGTMNFRLTALSVILVLVAGCASVTPPLSGYAGNAASDKEIGDPEARDTLISECRVPCNVSPGPGCC